MHKGSNILRFFSDSASGTAAKHGKAQGRAYGMGVLLGGNATNLPLLFITSKYHEAYSLELDSALVYEMERRGRRVLISNNVFIYVCISICVYFSR